MNCGGLAMFCACGLVADAGGSCVGALWVWICDFAGLFVIVISLVVDLFLSVLGLLIVYG